jgi:hypothetical protein
MRMLMGLAPKLEKNGTCFLILCLNLKMVGVAGVAGDG